MDRIKVTCCLGEIINHLFCYYLGDLSRIPNFQFVNRFSFHKGIPFYELISIYHRKKKVESSTLISSIGDEANGQLKSLLFKNRDDLERTQLNRFYSLGFSERSENPNHLLLLKIISYYSQSQSLVVTILQSYQKAIDS